LGSVASRQSRVTDTTQGRKARFSYMPNGFGRTDIITCCALGKGLVAGWRSYLTHLHVAQSFVPPSLPEVRQLSAGAGSLSCAHLLGTGANTYLQAMDGVSLPNSNFAFYPNLGKPARQAFECVQLWNRPQGSCPHPCGVELCTRGTITRGF
jgi:hypothetical protein